MTMNLPIVRTSFDLQTQELVGAGKDYAVKDPLDTIDPSIKAALQGNPFFFEYLGVKVLTRQSEAFPNPTFNHYTLAKFLNENKSQFNQNAHASFADLGSGVSYMGNFASMHLPFKEIIFADLNPYAIDQAVFSYHSNHRILLTDKLLIPHEYYGVIDSGKHRLDFRIGDAQKTLANRSIDTAVACPMFIPYFCEVFPQAYELFARTAKRSGADLFVAHSSLAKPWVERAANLSGMNLDVVFEQTNRLFVEYIDSRDREMVVAGVESTDIDLHLQMLKDKLAPLGLIIHYHKGEPPTYFHNTMISKFS